MRYWSAGELVRACGITVRALHHYDDIGLLTPGERTSAGHRRYDESDVRRLYRIRALRQLGVPLDRIGRALDDDVPGLRDLLTAQLADLESRAHRLAELRDRVHSLLTGLEDGVPPVDGCLTALETLSLFDTYLNPEQRDALAARRAELGRDRVDDLREEWFGVLGELRRHQRADTPATDPEVRRLADRWDAIGEALQPPGDGVKARVADLWRDHGDRIGERFSTRVGWDPTAVADVLAYLNLIRSTR